MEAAGGAVDDGLGAAQQNFEAILLNGGMKTADDEASFISEGLGEVVGFEDKFAGAFVGAEEGDSRILQRAEVADQR